MPFKDPAKRLEYRRQYRADNIEKCRKWGREHARRKGYTPKLQSETRKLYMSEYNASYYERNKEREQARGRDYGKRRKQENPRAIKNNELMAHYGITLEEYTKTLQNQEGVCAICKRPERATLKGKLRSLAVDHDHETGKVRGLLCGACNSALGLLGEDIERFEASIKYLRKHG